MKNLKLYLLISLAINIVLAYIILKPVQQNTHLEKALINKIKEQHKADEARILSDSLRHVDIIKSKEKKINTINYLRKNERNLYQLELSKIQLLNSDSSYVAAIDSIKKVCCTSTSR